MSIKRSSLANRISFQTEILNESSRRNLYKIYTQKWRNEPIYEYVLVIQEQRQPSSNRKPAFWHAMRFKVAHLVVRVNVTALSLTANGLQVTSLTLTFQFRQLCLSDINFSFSPAGISRSENALHTNGFSFVLYTSSGIQSEYLIYFLVECVKIYIRQKYSVFLDS